MNIQNLKKITHFYVPYDEKTGTITVFAILDPSKDMEKNNLYQLTQEQIDELNKDKTIKFDELRSGFTYAEYLTKAQKTLNNEVKPQLERFQQLTEQLKRNGHDVNNYSLTEAQIDLTEKIEDLNKGRRL